MVEQKMKVFNIQKFSLNDGPGIRTTVFLKGCMLKCIWCHNPESQAFKPQLMLHEEKCIGCGKCEKLCSKNLHCFDGEHTIDRDNCIACGECANECVGALEIVGRDCSVSEVIDEVMKDKVFYDNSHGGITLSGGEPLAQFDATLALLRAAKEKGIHTCIETCGYAEWEKVKELLPYTDLFLWDCKETNSDLHMEYTGVSNDLILENLNKLSESGAEIILRCPIIPGKNDREDHFEKIGMLSEKLKSVKWVEILPYHPLGKGKNRSLGKEDPLCNLTFPSDETVKEWIDKISKHTAKVVKKA